MVKVYTKLMLNVYCQKEHLDLVFLNIFNWQKKSLVAIQSALRLDRLKDKCLERFTPLRKAGNNHRSFDCIASQTGL